MLEKSRLMWYGKEGVKQCCEVDKEPIKRHKTAIFCMLWSQSNQLKRENKQLPFFLCRWREGYIVQQPSVSPLDRWLLPIMLLLSHQPSTCKPAGNPHMPSQAQDITKCIIIAVQELINECSPSIFYRHPLIAASKFSNVCGGYNS